MSKKSRKRKLEGEEDQSMVQWEQKNIFPGEIKSEMESMWEIPQIFHFLRLAREALDIPDLSMYETERMLMIPRASKQLANIMTSFLSSPINKSKLRKIPPMPYEFWTNILAYKMKSWFQVYEGKHRDVVKVLETIGVEPEFWSVFPDALLNGKDFEELTFKQRVWLLKTVCDTVMHSRKTVQEEVAKQPWEDQFETVLGTDRYGAKYIYFPQFLNTDLRIYRHCLDNKILSTVKPIKQKVKTDPVNAAAEKNNAMVKKSKHKRKKPRWKNGLPPRMRRRANRCQEKHLNDCKWNSDSATGSLINEDTNLSSASTCSNNNNVCSNNNNVSLDTVDEKRPRRLSKCSETSTTSDQTHCKSTKSSGYDTNSSGGTISVGKPTQKMFKGFSNSSTDKCSIEIISGILRGIQSEISERKGTDAVDISLIHSSQNKLESNRQQYLDLRIDSESVDRTENLSNVSKTDDEKLNEIISAETFKLNDKNSNDFQSRERHQMSSSSKSDDEKLSETRTTGNCAAETSNTSLTMKNGKVEVVEENGQVSQERKLNDLCPSDEKTSGSTDNKETESQDDKDLSLNELRSMLQKEAMEDNFDLDEDIESSHHDREMRNKDNCKLKMNGFNEMLAELGVSKFELVADSVNSLRDLISTFSTNSSTPNADVNSNTPNADVNSNTPNAEANSNTPNAEANCSTPNTGTNCNTSNDTDNDDDEPIPPCEEKLVNKLIELLSSLEEMEPDLQKSMKRARLKLQKEWTKFKEGVEDQDSSGEGLGSNWWVLGSQGCPLQTHGDATLQTLPQATSSRVCTQSACTRNDDRRENGVDECAENEGDTQSETQERSEDRRGSAGTEEGTQEDSNEEEQQTRRVLRARGISSYTEQLFSEDEGEENELDVWTEVEAVYAAPSTQDGASPSYLTPKVKHSDEQANEEDSDKDWILPSSRKRKNKRPSANRRLKSFQHKLQSIKVDELQNAAESVVASPSSTKNDPEKPKINEAETCSLDKQTDPPPSSNPAPSDNSSNANNTIESHEAAVETEPRPTLPPPIEEPICKVENVESVHSELDIKDEGPIYDCAPNTYDNSYAASFNSNYVMVKTEQNPMNYYVMQQNPTTVVPQTAIVQSGPVVSSIMPPINQSYYVQGGQNYFVQNPQSSFMPPQTFQPQGPQMLSPQQFINHPGYVPYMVTATQQPQPGYMEPQLMAHQIPQTSVPFHPYAPAPPRPQVRQPISRQSHPPHPNGAVIRSSMPIRGATPRAGNPRTTKNTQQQRGGTAKVQKTRKQGVPVENASQKTTSLIVLSDSDDEIEMIITEKTSPEVETEKARSVVRKNAAQPVVQPRLQPPVTPEVPVAASRGTIPPQIIQRMSQGGISITPIKPAPQIQSTHSNTQLVVVVNETGSHYALALPNGSKLILTPEQVAQIRASNGGKLML